MIIGIARSANCHSFKETKAMAKNNANAVLPNTSIERSKISSLKPLSKMLRSKIPPASAQTKVGNSNAVPMVRFFITSAKPSENANIPKVVIALSAVIRRTFCGASNAYSLSVNGAASLSKRASGFKGEANLCLRMR